MVNTDTLAGRLKQARLQAAVRRGHTVSQERMAELVSKEIHRPLWQAQWSSYERGEAPPPLDVIASAAKLSGLDPGYLAFGPKAPEPAPAQVIDVPHPNDRLITVLKPTAKAAKTVGKKPRR